MRLANGRFVRKEDQTRLREAAGGVSDEELQRLVKELGVEGALAELRGRFKAAAPTHIGKRRSPFRRVIRTIYDDDAGTVRYLHATKGWRTRKVTQTLLYQLSGA